MAGSRIEKLGSVFTRVSGLLKSGVLKDIDKPVWYDVMAAFPPKIDPKYDRPVDEGQVRDILYKEDIIRVKYRNSFDTNEVIDLTKIEEKYANQRFIDAMKDLKSTDCTLSDADLFKKTAEKLNLKEVEIKIMT